MLEPDRPSAWKSRWSGVRKEHAGRRSRSIWKRLWCALPIHMLCSSGAGIVGVAQLGELGEALSPGAFCQFRRAAAPLHDYRKTLDSPAMPLLRHSCTIPPPTPVCPAQPLFRRDLAHGRTPLRLGVAAALPRAYRNRTTGHNLGPAVSPAQDQSRALSHDSWGYRTLRSHGQGRPDGEALATIRVSSGLGPHAAAVRGGTRWPGTDSKRGLANRSLCKSIPAILV